MAPGGPPDARRWQDDVLVGFEQVTLAMPPSFDGPVETVVTRRRSASDHGAAVLYIHGYIDYFFQTHLADFYNDEGLHFYAVDLRRHGRALRSHQQPNVMRSIDEHLADVDAAIEVLVHEEGIDRLLLNGHSTGGLAAALCAHRGEQRERVSALFLNSPFLDLNVSAWQKRFVAPVLARLGGRAPNLRLPGVSPLYGQGLHVDHRGVWEYDLNWKPVDGFPTRAGWFRAIRAAHHEIAQGLDIACPVLVMHSERSAWPDRWNADVQTADIVLDVSDIRRLAPRLGRAVEVVAVPGGIHDLVLSDRSVRGPVFEHLHGWLQRVLPVSGGSGETAGSSGV